MNHQNQFYSLKDAFKTRHLNYSKWVVYGTLNLQQTCTHTWLYEVGMVTLGPIYTLIIQLYFPIIVKFLQRETQEFPDQNIKRNKNPNKTSTPVK